MKTLVVLNRIMWTLGLVGTVMGFVSLFAVIGTGTTRLTVWSVMFWSSVGLVVLSVVAAVLGLLLAVRMERRSR